jgi:hypothetical protein
MPELCHFLWLKRGNYEQSVLQILQVFSETDTLQRTNTENWKQIFPEKELDSHSPNFQVHVSVRSDFYIPTIGLPILLQKMQGPIQGIFKSLTDT